MEIQNDLNKIKENVVTYLLQQSRLSSSRRGSKVIRETDVKFAIEKYKEGLTTHKFYVIPVSGNGGCLFTSIRLSMELSYVLSKIDEGNPLEKFVLNGYSENMLQASNNIRSKIVEWFRRFLNREIIQLGNYIEGENGRKYQRGDLLALEMVRNGKDVPESGPERDTIILKYLLKMSLPHTWGSTPEYTAAACMTGKRINIWQNGNDGLFIINTVNGSLSNEDDTNNEEDLKELSDDQKDDLNKNDLNVKDDFKDLKDDLQKNAELDAEIYDDDDVLEIKSCESEDDNSDDEHDLSYNLYYNNNHYMPIVTHTQYLKLISVYGIDKFNNFKVI